MNEFQLDTQAELKHINPRKEGPEDDKELALDLKFCAPVEIDTIGCIMGAESEAELRRAFWREDEGHNPRFLVGHEVRVLDIEFAHMRLRGAGLALDDCTLKKFSFEPQSGPAASLIFQVSVKPRDDSALARLADYLGETMRIRIEPMQGALELEGAA